MRDGLWSAAAIPYHYPHLFKPRVYKGKRHKRRVILSAAKDLTTHPQKRTSGLEFTRSG